MSPPTPSVVDNVEASRFEIPLDGHVAFLDYERRPQTLVLIHTEVPPELRGRGLAALLARAGLDAAKAEGRRAIPRCPFVRAYLVKHPELAPAR
jgi:uncharacterized protein